LQPFIFDIAGLKLDRREANTLFILLAQVHEARMPEKTGKDKDEVTFGT